MVPSSTMKSTFVPPLNIKSPPPLVSKTRGTSISVPAVVIPPVFDISNCVAAAPSINLGVAVSTLKNGVVDPNVELTCNPVVSIPVLLRFVVSVPAVETPITSPLDLNKPVVRELSNVNDGVAAAPSLSFISALSIVLSAPDTVIPPVNVHAPVTDAVPVTATPACKFACAVDVNPTNTAAPDAAMFQLVEVIEPSGWNAS